MMRPSTGVAAGVLVCLLASAVSAADSDIEGTIKKIDAARGFVTITVGDKDYEYAISEQSKLFEGGKSDPLEGGLKNKVFKEGSRLLFRTAGPGYKVDGRPLILGATVNPVKLDLSGLKPLTEFGTGLYKGFPGGLYPGGKDERPEAHEKAGLTLAKSVQPLDAEGTPSPDGKIVLLSVGMSNTTQSFEVFKKVADADKDKNPKLAIVDGAQGGMAAGRIRDPEKGTGRIYWKKVDERLKAAGVTPAQVQVAWIKQANVRPAEPFPKHAEVLEDDLVAIVRHMRERFPNLKLVYLSSRTYGGYTQLPLNPEPYAFEGGFAVKWLIEKQIKGEKELNFDPKKGEVKAPWLGWGPYLWAKGTTPRADGLLYKEEDFNRDGTHPSESGRKKVADQLLRFFKTDSTAKGWFLGR